MLEYIILLGVVAIITFILFFLVTVGTKETSFEDALAEQRKLRDGPSNKNKKTKVIYHSLSARVLFYFLFYFCEQILN